MIDEMALQREVNRARRAKALLDDPMLQEILNQMEEDFISGWRICMHPDLREQFWNKVTAIAAVRQKLESILSGGVMAQAELDGKK